MATPPITWKRALSWCALVVLLLVGADQAQRFGFYEVTAKDRGSLRIARRPIKDALLSGLHALPNTMHAPPGATVFDLYLKPTDEDVLRDHATRVQLLGTHDEVTKSWVGARLAVEGQEFDVEVKLRGRQYYHVIWPRPSLRVKLQHGRTWRGAGTFNLVDPFDKTGDQIFLWESQHHGLIAWDTTMGCLALRGELLCAVQYVEQPRVEMSRRNGRPEGLFFRGSGEIYEEGSDPARCKPVVARVVHWLGDTQGTLSWPEFQELFDVERTRWFTALTELSGDGHGFADFNMKGFCDPDTLKCELLIWDTRFGEWSEVATSQFAANGTQLLRCDEYRVRHDRALHELVGERLAPMLATARAFQEQFGPLLAQDPLYLFPRGGPDGGFMADRPHKLEATIRRNAAAIAAALEGSELAWHVDASARVLELATSERGSKVVTALRLRAEGTEGPEGTGAERVRELAAPLTVYGAYRARRPLVRWPLPADVDPAALVGLVAHNDCTGVELAPRESAEPLRGDAVPWQAEPGRAPLPELPDGFTADAERGLVTLGPGEVELAGVLTLPRGWNVSVAPGTSVRAAAGSLLEVQGDLALRGTALEPITWTGSAGADTWGALAVRGERAAPAVVEIAHTSFRGGAGSELGLVRHPASLSLAFTRVRLEHVDFADSRGALALWVQDSAVSAGDCRFRGGAGGALAYARCTGRDERTRVADFAGDGVRLAGSELELVEPWIEEVRRGLVLDAAARARVSGATVLTAEVGCALADQCDAELVNLTLIRPGTAVAALLERSGFAPPRARFRGLVVVDAPALALLDAGAQVDLGDAVRIGADGAQRPFDGVRAEVEPGLARRSTTELAALAARARGSAPGEPRGY